MQRYIFLNHLFICQKRFYAVGGFFLVPHNKVSRLALRHEMTALCPGVPRGREREAARASLPCGVASVFHILPRRHTFLVSAGLAVLFMVDPFYFLFFCCRVVVVPCIT